MRSGLLNAGWISHTKAMRGQAQKSGMPMSSDASLKEVLWCDVGQAVQRKPWLLGSLKALCQNSIVYSYAKAGIFHPEHHVRLQGWPRTLKLHGISPHELRGVAGEGFCFPCIGAILLSAALLPDTPWWSSPGPGANSSTDAIAETLSKKQRKE